MINAFVAAYGQNRDYGLRCIRNAFFLNFGMLLISLSFVGFEKANLIIPAILFNGFGIIDCLIAGWVGWKHWILQGDANAQKHTQKFVPVSVIIVAFAYCMWVCAIIVMLGYYELLAF